MGSIFIAFAGFKDKNKEKIFKMEGIEIWNLELLPYKDFIGKIENICPSIMNKFDNDYLREEKLINCYNNCNWGILFENNSNTRYEEIHENLLAMELYSGIYLPIMFYITEYLVLIENIDIEIGEKAGFHNIDEIFKNNNFPIFYNKLLPRLKNINWDTNKVKKWNKEQFRLYTTLLLFRDLKKYQNKKYVMTWEKECSEIVTIYENLLSRRKNDNGRYKILQRIEIVLGNYLNNELDKMIEGLKKLFDYRNDFIHGSFFYNIQKSINDKSTSGLPDIEWEFLKYQTKILRLTIIAFIYLCEEYNNEIIPELIHKCIMDIEKRKEIQQKIETIMKLTYIK